MKFEGGGLGGKGEGGAGAGVGATVGGDKLLLITGTIGAGMLVLATATPPSTSATMPIDKEKMNMHVTVLIPREGGGEAKPGALTSTSNGTIRFISAMTRYYSKRTWRTSDALGLQRVSTFYKTTFRPVVKLGGGRERHRAPLALPAAS